MVMYKMFLMFTLATSLVSTPYIYTTETVPIEPGTYPVIVYYDNNGKEVSTISNTTIGSSNFVGYGDVAIDASDIYTTKDQELTTQFLITNSQVKAWNTKDNSSYNIDKIVVEQVEEDMYTVSFQTLYEITTTINVYLVEEEQIYTMYSSDEEESYLNHYVNENYLGFLFVVALIILCIVALILFISAQYSMKKQMNDVLKLMKR